MNAAAKILLCAICLFAGLQLVPKASAQGVDASAAAVPGDVFFVLGNIEYIVLHELAHLLINDLEIPIIGSEESAADYLATATLIRADRFDPNRAARAREFLFATANGLAGSWDFNSQAGVDVHFWDSHALTIQRFFQIVCLIYGSNQTEYAALPALVGMPEQRAALCPAEYQRADRSMRWLLDNYGRDPAVENAAIELVFERPPTRVSQQIAEAITATEMLENTIRRLDERFRIPEAFRIVFRQCGSPQARWLPDAREIVVCYELLDSYYALGVSQRTDRVRRRQEP